jgi:hypothetical protein
MSLGGVSAWEGVCGGTTGGGGRRERGDRRIDVFAIPKTNSEVVQTNFMSRHKFHFAKEGFAARKIE